MKIVIDIPDGMINAFTHEEQWTALLCADMNDILQKGIPLPRKHGRLIDADEVKKDHIRWLGYLDEDMIIRLNLAVDKIPTVLNADKGDTE